MNGNNDMQWIMQLTQAMHAAQQSAVARPGKESAAGKKKEDFQSLLENKKAEESQQAMPEKPLENGEEPVEEGAAAQVLLPFFQQLPLMQFQLQGEDVPMSLAEVLPVGAEVLQGTELPQAAQTGIDPALLGEEISAPKMQGTEPAQAEPVLLQADEAEMPVETTGVQEPLELARPMENGGALLQSEAGDDTQEKGVEMQAQAGGAEQPLFSQMEQMPQKVGQPEALDLKSPEVENQLKARIVQAAEQDIQKMELQLEPEGLGKLVIQMEKSPEGALRVVLQASNETALRMLKDHSDSLGLMLQNSQPGPVRLEVQRQEEPEQNLWNQQEQNQNQSRQQQQQRRQEDRQSEDFLQKLRLGLMPA